MHFQFLIEDHSTAILTEHIIKLLQEKYVTCEITYDIKSFHGIGGLSKKGNALAQKTGKLLNDLPMYLRAFNKKLSCLDNAIIVVVLDNDDRNPEMFRNELENIVVSNMVLVHHVFGIAIKEMEAWLLGDAEAVKSAYPNVKLNAWKNYEQDAICDTWQILANAVYPGGLKALKKKAGSGYAEIGKAKAQWAQNIGEYLELDRNASPSFKRFIGELCQYIEAA